MILTLLKRNVRHQRGLLASLAVGMSAFTVLIVNIAAAFDSGPGFTEILNILPPFLRNLAGAQISDASFPAFVAFAFQHPAVMTPSIAVMIVAATIPAGERDTGTLELLLARPLARWRYLAATVLTLLIDALTLAASLVLGLIVGFALVDAEGELSWTRYLACAFGFAILLLALGGFAMLVGAGAPRRGTAVVRVVAVIVPLYVIEALADLWAPLQTIRWLSPFHYFKPISVVMTGVPAHHPLVLAGILLVCTAGAFAWFIRRDV